MTLFLNAVFWAIGIITGSFGIMQIVICLTFGIPYTIKLQREGALIRPNPIIKSHIITIMFWLIIVVAAFLLISKHLSQYFIAFCVGNIAPILFGLGKIGRNPTNIQDYDESHAKYFIDTSPEDIQSDQAEEEDNMKL